ncbi:LexA-binding, inner membrane-associated putative hydrolase [Halogranum gelatinilyticum]|uniref:LexA-binding, inner membrane-associated putative hydrolase n=1 Tax=Halogranum gelatinilyticum TaxID=660521 RepID=A0A1G9T7J7_9EURY|nr:metal-dependent hydrolase [Halogranum gelatinilyticum]SDM43602.1 LexA-binding, inner membrane-associated putative hydrolase [Halogranum gelatinilyticum]
MFIGHALLAFALVASVAAFRGWPRERALTVGIVAGLFAAAPDVDIAYALVGVATASVTDALALAGVFWQTGNLVHRAVTHSLVVAVVVSVAVGLVTSWRRAEGGAGARPAGAAGLVVATALVAVAGAVSGVLGASVMGLFVLVSLAVAVAAADRTDLDAKTVASAALVGVASHPFGDLFTGEPPAMLYPFEVTLVAERVTLHEAATLHLLSAFGLELATVWAAALVALWLTGRSLRTVVDPRAALGVGYAASLLVIPAPTLDLSYPFVFTVLAVGAIGATPRMNRRGRTGADGASAVLTGSPVVGRFAAFELPDRYSAALTGLAAVTLAWLAYSVLYLVA